MLKQKTPKKFRRLTRAEAARLGVKYSSKRQVDASLKRITKRSKTYSERFVYQHKFGITKEEHALKVKSKKFELKGSTHFNNLTEAQFKRLVHKYQENHDLSPSFLMETNRYQGQGVRWVGYPMIGEGEFYEVWPDIEDYYGMTKTHKPQAYGLVVHGLK
jgi:hypothetical protein